MFITKINIMRISSRKKALRLLLNVICVTLLAFSAFSVAIASTDVWVANGDDTVTDLATGLMWQQQDDDITRDHTTAVSYCQNLSLAGHADWRLPNIKELNSIVDFRQSEPAIDTTAFPNTNSTQFWSASSLAINTNLAWSVEFAFGVVFALGKTDVLLVRCVR